MKQSSAVTVRSCPHQESRGLSHPHETDMVEAPLRFPTVAVHPYRPSSCRASAASSPDSTFSSSSGCSSQGLGKATTSSHSGLAAREHVCPKRSSARAWFLPTSHSLELLSLSHLVIRWGRYFSRSL